MKVQVSLDIMYIYQNTDKIRFQRDCICIVADKVVQWWTYVTYSYVIPCACLYNWMPQEMLRMCNKGLFAGVGLSGLKLHCFYDILRLYSYGWTILPLPQCLMFKQALKSGYNACLKICNNFTATINIPENPASWADLD